MLRFRFETAFYVNLASKTSSMVKISSQSDLFPILGVKLDIMLSTLWFRDLQGVWKT